MTTIISGFPGVGKTELFSKYSNTLKIADSDSSTFNKSEFPNNYIRHIRAMLEAGSYDYILVSSHRIVNKHVN